MEAVLNLCVNKEVVHEDHAKKIDVPMAGQCGEWTTKVAIGKRFYWPKMKQDVEHFMHICVKCQNTKSIYKNKYGLYKHLLIPNKPWENISMDFMTQLSKWNGMDAILVVVDQLSKLVKWLQLRQSWQLSTWQSRSLICASGIMKCHNL